MVKSKFTSAFLLCSPILLGINGEKVTNNGFAPNLNLS